MPVDFDKQAYWHQRFATETQFEWLVPSSVFMSIIEPYLQDVFNRSPSPRILQIGFGTSDLQNHLRARGLLDVLNIDYEPLAIDRGRHLEKQAFGDVQMRYAVADATQLYLPGNPQFDLVLDKSTVDAVSCGGEEAFLRMARGVRRSLSPGGIWISLSYSSSRFNVEELPFEVTVVAKVPTAKIKATDPDIYHWCYLMRPKDGD